jgi:F-type H+-transporting ATPase subunit epsilon
MAIPTQLALELVTPDHLIAHESVDEVQLPGVEGYLGVLPGHTPMLVTLGVGQMWYRRGQERFYLSVAEGLAEILPDRVIVLSLTAERAEEIDLMRAEAAREHAESLMRSGANLEDLERARIAMLKAMSRIQVATRARTRI